MRTALADTLSLRRCLQAQHALGFPCHATDAAAAVTRRAVAGFMAHWQSASAQGGHLNLQLAARMLSPPPPPGAARAGY